MATIIGRKQEIQELRQLYNSTEAEMAVVYGRRRVGKTFLVNHTFASEGFTFKLTGLYKAKLKTQLENFAFAIREYANDETIKKTESWMQAFAQLKTLLTNRRSGKKQIVFFDELPWLDTKGSQFLKAFEWFWNSWGNAQDDLLFIICGSATNWIINKLFKQKGGLYNRANSKIYLHPFTLAETEQYLQHQGIEWQRYDIAQIYMIMGGIPYYLKQLEPSRTLTDNIDNCFFKTNGKLWDEFDNLYQTLFDHSELYLRIVEALASKRIGLTRKEILSLTRLHDNGTVTQALRDLNKCGFVEIYSFFNNKTKNQIYQLSDFYTLFYLKFIKTNYGQDRHFWTHMLDNPQKNVWLGYTFELLVKNHIEQVKRALGIGSVLTRQSGWFIQNDNSSESTGAQIDLIIDRRDHAINLCEVKFVTAEFVISKDYALKMRNKTAAFTESTKTRKSIVPTMITTFGIKQNSYSSLIQQQVVLDDLFV